jgi:hypothetical protein
VSTTITWDTQQEELACMEHVPRPASCNLYVNMYNGRPQLDVKLNLLGCTWIQCSDLWSPRSGTEAEPIWYPSFLFHVRHVILSLVLRFLIHQQNQTHQWHSFVIWVLIYVRYFKFKNKIRFFFGLFWVLVQRSNQPSIDTLLFFKLKN